MSLWTFAAVWGLAVLMVGGAAAAADSGDGGESGGGRAVPNREPLLQTPFVPLPLGSVKPEGWLKKQLELQRDGLTGHAETIYDALQPDSGWLGGDGENWEKGPYYVKGLVTLAYGLDDAELQQRARKWIDWALESQREDGSFGPEKNDDWWPRMVALYFLRDYQEATGDARVLPFFQRYFRHQLTALRDRPLTDWGKARAGDNIDVVLWTYNRTGDPFLLDLARLLHQQAYPWSEIYTENQFYGRFDGFQTHHIVNISQALRLPPLVYQFTKDAADRDAFMAGGEHLMRQYGRIDGQPSGSEMLSNLSSTAAVEFCADVERMLSNEIAITILGDPRLGDQLERIAFNSAAAHLSHDAKQLTYYQFPNQVSAADHPHGFEQDYSNGNTPSPHSGFPCCCYNWHHGWPYYLKHLWAATADGGVAAMAYGPSRVQTIVAGDQPVTITQVTDYPFRDSIELTLDLDRPAAFPLVLRIPGWCEAPRITINGEAVAGVTPETFHRLERTWNHGDTVRLTFPMAVRVSQWINNSVGLSYGPLAFSLDIQEDWRKAHDFHEDFDAYEVFPASPWNYALVLDPARPERTISVEQRPMTDTPFTKAHSPLRLRAKARRLPEWTVAPAPSHIIVGKADGGWSELARAPVELPDGRPSRLRVEAEGPQIRVFVNDADTPAVELVDDSFASGALGLRSWKADVDFTGMRINAHLLDARSERIEPHGGEWSVDAGRIRARGEVEHKALLPGEHHADFRFEAEIDLRSASRASDAGLIFRVSDVAGGQDAYRGYYAGLAPGLPAEARDAQEPPQSPVPSGEPIEEIELVPFGAGAIRVTYFPHLAQ